MTRRQRQRAIVDIVGRSAVGSQEELVSALERRGIRATQSTVSRDLRELGLLKLPEPDGGSRYVLPGHLDMPEDPTRSGLRMACRQFVTEVASAEAMLVLRTDVGCANAVAAAIDDARQEEIAGTLAGDDTIVLLLRRANDRDKVLQSFQAYLE